MSSLIRALCLASATAAALACSSDPTIQRHGENGGGGSTGGGSGTTTTNTETIPQGGNGNGNTTGICGDGILNEKEACDDGGTDEDDGCSADCSTVDAGYLCIPAGRPCRPFAVCGDGILGATEQCDDGGKEAGDGCSPQCQFEPNKTCSGEPSVCVDTTCGDGVREGGEGCDDGNLLPFDGCNPKCQKEPDCSGSSCVSACGDGLVINEECDDANNIDGDGCSASCEKEAGFTCTRNTECEKLDGTCILRVPAIFRDFKAQGDFTDPGSMVKGLVETTLTNGKPVLLSTGPSRCNTITSTASFAAWYSDAPEHAMIPADTGNTIFRTADALPGEIVLFDNGSGNFVNRYLNDGTQWCNNAQTTCLDGNPLFFPVDSNIAGETFRTGATVQGAYTSVNNNAGSAAHNFGFTSEILYWFEYDAEAPAATLTFLGDDDVWVFVNNRLALDLGCVHGPVEDSFTLNPAFITAKNLGLEDGKVYPIRIFHAERNFSGSSFKLTLSGFNPARSVCESSCGDGVVGGSEECDDGTNDGGYGECQPGCVLGGYCGDGTEQAGEDCDDGNRVNGDGCDNSCRILSVD